MAAVAHIPGPAPIDYNTPRYLHGLLGNPGHSSGDAPSATLKFCNNFHTRSPEFNVVIVALQ